MCVVRYIILSVLLYVYGVCETECVSLLTCVSANVCACGVLMSGVFHDHSPLNLPDSLSLKPEFTTAGLGREQAQDSPVSAY